MSDRTKGALKAAVFEEARCCFHSALAALAFSQDLARSTKSRDSHRIALSSGNALWKTYSIIHSVWIRKLSIDRNDEPTAESSTNSATRVFMH